jgi:hypothetical protein
MMTTLRIEESTAVATPIGPTLVPAFELGERTSKLSFTRVDLGSAQRKLASDIVRISPRTSAETGGRPRRHRLFHGAGATGERVLCRAFTPRALRSRHDARVIPLPRRLIRPSRADDICRTRIGVEEANDDGRDERTEDESQQPKRAYAAKKTDEHQ